MGASQSAVAKKLESLSIRGSIKSIDVANLLDARPETVSRWNRGKSFPRDKILQTLLELEYLVDQLSDFYSADEVRVWLYSPQKLLGGDKPADLVKNGKIDKVRAAIDQMRDGVFL